MIAATVRASGANRDTLREWLVSQRIVYTEARIGFRRAVFAFDVTDTQFKVLERWSARVNA